MTQDNPWHRSATTPVRPNPPRSNATMPVRPRRPYPVKTPRYDANAARSPPLLGCALAEPPIAPAIRRLRPQRGNPAAKLDASAAIRQERYDASWGKSTMPNKFVTYSRLNGVAAHRRPAHSGAIDGLKDLWDEDGCQNGDDGEHADHLDQGKAPGLSGCIWW
jgi:hypothetical protein